MLISLFTGAALAGTPGPALLQDVHERAVRTEQRGMAVLGGWAVANIAGGVAGSLLADDPTRKAFHQGNAAWNTVNLAIAGAGLVGTRRRAAEDPQWPALPVQLANQRGVFLLNLGLDVAYTSSGALLWTIQDDPTRQGYGQALVLQGAFLGVFDLSMALLNARCAAPLRPYVSGDSVGVAVSF